MNEGPEEANAEDDELKMEHGGPIAPMSIFDWDETEVTGAGT